MIESVQSYPKQEEKGGRIVMDKHFTVLGALYFGLGIMGLAGLLFVLALFSVGSAVLGTVAAQEPDLPAPGTGRCQ